MAYLIGAALDVKILATTNIYNVWALGKGGAIYTEDSTSSSIQIDSSNFNRVFAYKEGGIAYHKGSTITFTSTSLVVYDSQSYQSKGGAFYFDTIAANTQTIGFITPTIDTSRAYTDGGVIYGAGSGNFAITMSGAVISSCSTTTGNGGLFAISSSGSIAYTQSSSTINHIQAQSNGGVGYAISSAAQVGVTFTSTTIDSPTAVNDNGGAFFLSASSTSTLTLEEVEVNQASAGTSGGFAHFEGTNVVISASPASPTKGLLITGSRAKGKDGGIFSLAHTGTSQITINPLTLTRTISAAQNGGIAAIGGTDVTIAITNFKVETCEAIGLNGGGFYLTNSGTNTFGITTGEIQGYCKASKSGGFIYQSSGIMAITLTSFISHNTYATRQHGGFIYGSLGANNGAITFATSLTADYSEAGMDGGFIWLSATDATLTLNSATLSHCSALSGNGGAIHLSNSGITSVTINGGVLSYLSAFSNGGLIYKTGGTTYTLTLDLSAKTSYTSAITGHGGLGYLSGSSTGQVIVKGASTIEHSYALGYDGGAFYLAGTGTSSVSITASSIVEYCIANRNGGVVAYTNSGSSAGVTLNAATIRYNRASYSGGFVYQNTGDSFTFTSTNANFDTNYNYYGQGGLAHISPTVSTALVTVTITGGSFRNSTAGTNGGGFSLGGRDIDIDVTTSDFYGMIANNGHGGTFYTFCSRNLNLDSTTTQYELSRAWGGSGGLLYASGAVDTAAITLNGPNPAGKVLAKDLYASQKGGMIYSQSWTATNIIIKLGGTYSTISSETQGGMIWTNSPAVSFTTLNGIVVEDVKSSEGGVLYHGPGTTGAVTYSVTGGSTFQKIKALQRGAFVYLDGTGTPTITFTLTSSNWYCNEFDLWYPGMYNYALGYAQFNSFDGGNLFYLGSGTQGNGASSTGITSNGNNFRRCYTSNSGGIFYLPPTVKFTDSTSNFEQNVATQGGNFYCDACVMIFTDSTFLDSMAFEGGNFYLMNAAQVTFNNIKMLHGRAISKGGSIYAGGSGSGHITFSSCAQAVSFFYSDQDGGFMYLDNNLLDFISSAGCGFSNMKAFKKGGFAYINALDVWNLQSSTMSNVTALEQGSLVYSQNAIATSITISSNTITCQGADAATALSNTQTWTYNRGSLLYFVNPGVTITLSGNTFSNCIGAEKGAVLYAKSLTISHASSTYNNNEALMGGAIYCEQCTGTISGSFSGNQAAYGGTLYIVGTTAGVTLSGVTVSSSTADISGGLVYATGTTGQSIPITVTGTSPLSNLIATTGNGGAFYLYGDAIALTIQGTTTITTSKSLKGFGGLIFTKQASSVTVNSASVTIKDLHSPLEGSIIYSVSPTAYSFTSATFDCTLSAVLLNPTSSATADALLKALKYDRGTPFYLISPASVTTNSMTLQNCYTGSTAGGFYIYGAGLTDIAASTFQHLAGLYGGAIHIENPGPASVSLSLTRTNINNCRSYHGAGTYLKGRSATILNRLIVNTLVAQQDGGFLYHVDKASTSGTASSIAFEYSATGPNINNFQSLDAMNNGGMLYINNVNMGITTQNQAITVTDSEAVKNGGVMYFENVGSVSLNQCTFTTFKAGDAGSLMYSIAPNIALVMTDNTITAMPTDFSAAADETTLMDNVKKQVGDRGGMIYVKGNGVDTSITSTNNNYLQNYLAKEGGAFTLVDCKMVESNSNFNYLAALKGGVISCNKCAFTLANSIFTNTRAYQGGVWYVNEYWIPVLPVLPLPFTQTGGSITNSKSYMEGGVGYLTGTSTQTWTFDNTAVTTCESTNDKAGYLYVDNANQALTVKRMTIDQCKAKQTGGIYNFKKVGLVQIGEALPATACTFKNFGPGEFGTFIYSEATALDLRITNTNVLGSTTVPVYATHLQASLESPAPGFTTKAAIYIKGSTAGVQSTKNQYANCYVGEDSGVFHLVDTILADTESTFLHNGGAYGAVFYTEKVVTITITGLHTGGPYFYDNYATLGGVFFFQDSTSLTLTDSSLIRNEAIRDGGVMHYISRPGYGPYVPAPTITITGTTFDDSKARLSGGVFYINSIYLSGLSLGSSANRPTSIKTTEATAGHGGIFRIEAFSGTMTMNTVTVEGFKVNNDDLTVQYQGSLMHSTASGLTLNVQSCTIKCQTTYDNTTSSALQGHLNSKTCLYGGAFYVENAVLVASTSNVFNWCFEIQRGSIFSLRNTKLTDSGSTFYANQAKWGGAIYADSSTMTLTSSKLYSNQAVYGGAIMYDNSVTATLNGVEIYENIAREDGGAILIEKSNLFSTSTASTLLITNCKQIYRNFAKWGAFLNADNNMVTVKIMASELASHQAHVRGGMMSIVNLAGLEINESILKYFSSVDSSFIYSIAEGLVAKINQNKITCNTTYSDVYNKYMLNNATHPQHLYSTPFYFKGAKSINSYKNTITHCNNAEIGGVFRVLDTELFVDESSAFRENSAVLGGVMSFSNTTININYTEFEFNQAHRAGVIHLERNSTLLTYQSKYKYNGAYFQSGVFQVLSESSIYIYDCDVVNNWSNDTSVLYALGTSRQRNNTIQESRISYNDAIKNSITLLYAKTYVRNSVFQQNNAIDQSKVFYVGFSNIYMDTVQFIGAQYSDPFSRLDYETTSGTYLYINTNTEITLFKSTFRNGISQYGGAIYVSEDANLTMIDTEFQSNYAKVYGGAIYASNFGSIQITKESLFDGNRALLLGDDLYVSDTKNKVSLNEITIINPNAKCSIYAEQVSLEMNKISIKNILSGSSSTGGAIQCINCNTLKVIDCVFDNIKSERGGVFYIQENENNKRYINDTQKYYFYNTKFTNNVAHRGGALYFNNPQNVYLSNCTFSGNKAVNSTKASLKKVMGSAAAFYYTCDEDYLDCKLELADTNVFDTNFADIKGGAIFWDVLEPVFGNKTTFSNNVAVLYGNNIATFASVLTTVSDDQYHQHLARIVYNEATYVKKVGRGNNRRLQTTQQDDVTVFDATTSTTVNDQRSGGTLPTTYIAYLDKYGQIVGSDWDTTIQLQIDGSYALNSSYNQKYTPLIEGQTVYTSVAGTAKLSGVTFVGAPGSTFKIDLSGDGIDESKPQNKQYLNETNKTSIQYEMVVNVRDCQIGEQFTEDGRCQVCPDGTSYSLSEMDQPGTCEACPDKRATCYGGTNVGPVAGYWRRTNMTSVFLKCFNEDACLGMFAPENDPKGSCNIGYKGVLCADCQPGFIKTVEYQCERCPSFASSVIRFIIVYALVIALIVAMIYLTLRTVTNRSSLTSIYLRQLINHLHLVLFTAAFNFNWTYFINRFYRGYKPAVQALSLQFNLDCMVNDPVYGYQGDSEILRLFFQKLIIFEGFPVFATLVAIGFWAIYKCVQKPLKFPWGKVLCTIIVILFFIHPNIVWYSFLDFRCVDIDGETRMLDDLEVKCWEKSHSIMTYLIAIPGLIVWGFGIPFLWLFFLFRQKNNFELNEMRTSWGFLVNGYKREFYYWEILIIYRKMLIIFISVFITQFGMIAQALILLLVLIIFTLLTVRLRPYEKEVFMNIETLSLIVMMISVYCGMYLIADTYPAVDQTIPDRYLNGVNLSEGTKFFFFILIVLANAIFILFWFYKVFDEFKAMMRYRFQNIYLLLCLCKDRRKFDKEIIAQRMRDENEILRDEYKKSIKELKDLYHKGHIVLNPLVLERFKYYISDQRVYEAIKQPRMLSKDQDEKFQKLFNKDGSKRKQQELHEKSSDSALLGKEHNKLRLNKADSFQEMEESDSILNNTQPMEGKGLSDSPSKIIKNLQSINEDYVPDPKKKWSDEENSFSDSDESLHVPMTKQAQMNSEDQWAEIKKPTKLPESKGQNPLGGSSLLSQSQPKANAPLPMGSSLAKGNKSGKASGKSVKFLDQQVANPPKEGKRQNEDLILEEDSMQSDLDASISGLRQQPVALESPPKQKQGYDFFGSADEASDSSNAQQNQDKIPRRKKK